MHDRSRDGRQGLRKRRDGGLARETEHEKADACNPAHALPTFAQDVFTLTEVDPSEARTALLGIERHVRIARSENREAQLEGPAAPRDANAGAWTFVGVPVGDENRNLRRVEGVKLIVTRNAIRAPNHEGIVIANDTIDRYRVRRIELREGPTRLERDGMLGCRERRFRRVGSRGRRLDTRAATQHEERGEGGTQMHLGSVARYTGANKSLATTIISSASRS